MLDWILYIALFVVMALVIAYISVVNGWKVGPTYLLMFVVGLLLGLVANAIGWPA